METTRQSRIMETLNMTVNGTQPQNCYSTGYLTVAKIGKTFGYCLFLVVSLTGNTLVAIIIYKTKTMRTTTNYFILNMAMSDLLLPILVFPSDLIGMYGGFWFFSNEQGHDFCKVLFFVKYVSSLVSIENLVLITVDRFRAVVFPFRAPLIGSKLCPFFILTSWVAAMALSSPIFFGIKSVEYTGRFQSCEWLWKQAFIQVADYYVYAMPFVLLAIAFPLIVVLYSVILFKLKSQTTPGQQSGNAVKQRDKRKRNVLRLAVAIVTGFVLCWGPATVFVVWNVSAWNNTLGLSCEIATWYILAIFMAHANCAVNPCICFAFSGKYREGLKALLGCH